jgi:membrane protease YdiL (CAAX protease family)
MQQAAEFLKRHSLVIGILLMFLLTWPIDLANSGILPVPVPFVVGLLLGWGFAFASLIMTGLTLGKDGVVALLKRFLIWRVNWKWYLVAFLLFPAMQFASVLLTAWLTGVPADFGNIMVYQVVPLAMNVLLLIVFWFLFEVITNGEEIGWRGYVLPRLQAKYNALVASLIVGVIWGAWHLPKFLGVGANSERSFAWFLVFVVAEAVLYTWLYNNTRGSLLLVTIFHASGNTAGAFLPISFAATGGFVPNIMILLYILAAIIVTILAGPERLSRTEQMQTQV